MALKDEWVDKIDGVDINSAEDINQIAHAVIAMEERGVTKWFYGTLVTGTGSNIFVPVGQGAKTGDFYLNTNTGNVYVSIGGAEMWKYLFSMKSN